MGRENQMPEIMNDHVPFLALFLWNFGLGINLHVLLLELVRQVRGLNLEVVSFEQLFLLLLEDVRFRDHHLWLWLLLWLGVDLLRFWPLRLWLDLHCVGVCISVCEILFRFLALYGAEVVVFGFEVAENFDFVELVGDIVDIIGVLIGGEAFEFRFL